MFEMSRVILFVDDPSTLVPFYRDTLGLTPVGDVESKEWIEFRAGATCIALHGGGGSPPAKRSPKLVFYSADVEATRAELIARGAKMGKVHNPFGDLKFCDGNDPAGNAFQISSR